LEEKRGKKKKLKEASKTWFYLMKATQLFSPRYVKKKIKTQKKKLN